MNVSGQSNSLPVKVPPPRLGDDMAQLLETSSAYDVILALGSREFKVHKAILSGEPGISYAYNWTVYMYVYSYL